MNKIVSRKAEKFHEIPQAVQFNEPVSPEHPFFVDLSGLRGEFDDNIIFDTFDFDVENKRRYSDIRSQSVLFLGGMRGSGKTSELARYAEIFHQKEGFFVITCNIDEGLNKNNMEYMDILIFQIERLVEELEKQKQLPVKTEVLESLNKWFSERVKEINTNYKGEVGINLGIGTPETGISLQSFLGIIANIKGSLSASKEKADKTREVFRQNFTDFAAKFNEFLFETTDLLRHKGMAREILFIVDGLEKALSADIRKKIILEESGRLQEIKANMIFTLPIELMRERRQLEQFAKVKMFPFIKISDKQNQPIQKAYQKLHEYIDKRIASSLWENEQIKDIVIEYSGGSPRELLRIIERAYTYRNREKKILDQNSVEKAIHNLASESAQYLSKEDFDLLKQIKNDNEQSKVTPYNDLMGKLLEDLIIFEYNDGTLKKVNPVVAKSQLYQQYVLSE